MCNEHGLLAPCHATALWGPLLGTHTVDARNSAPPTNPWNVDSLVNTNKQWFLIHGCLGSAGFRPSTVVPHICVLGFGDSSTDSENNPEHFSGTKGPSGNYSHIEKKP